MSSRLKLKLKVDSVSLKQEKQQAASHVPQIVGYQVKRQVAGSHRVRDLVSKKAHSDINIINQQIADEKNRILLKQSSSLSNQNKII